MLLNYFKVAIRNFLKHPIFTVLNVLGLSVGLTASLLIFQYIKYEKSFDSFHTRLHDIYRIQYNGWQNGKRNFESALAVPPVGPALKANFTEVESFVRFFPVNGVIKYEGSSQNVKSFYEKKIFYVDRFVFDIFDFQLLRGDKAACLVGVNKVLISESSAKRYFDEDEPIGKRIQYNNRDFEVTGVFRDVPENSHIQFDFLFSFETLAREMNDVTETGWGWYDFYVYVLLRPGTDLSLLQAKWDNWLDMNRKPEWDKNNSFQEFLFKPVSAIHLHSHLLYEVRPTDQRDVNAVNALGIIAVFILIIAWVNYTNLSTARAINRANEVGVRKVVGASYVQLRGQFLAESALINFIAVVIALVVVLLTWDIFSALAGWNIPFGYLYEAQFWQLVVLLFFGGTVLSGFYPAIVLSSFKPIAVLKGKMIGFSRGSRLRKGLVIFQFVTSVLLIVGAMVVSDQIEFMKTKELGINIRNKLVLRAPVFSDTTYFRRVQSFKNEALYVPGVSGIATANNVPGDEIFWTSHVGRLSGGPNGDLIFTSLGIDDQYLSVFDIAVREGRNFDRERVNENRFVLINEALAMDLEFKNLRSAIGEKLRVRQSMTQYDTLEIAGVIADHHHMSLQAKVLPTIYRYTPWSSYYTIQMESGDYSDAIQDVEEQWKSFFPGNPFEFFVLEDFFNHQYDEQVRFANVFNLFTALAIFIALLGLFGLAAFITIQRTKEIGIRKVLGSSVFGIVWLFTRGFLKPVLIANLIAWPIAWLVATRWLEQFPYRVSINPFIFVLAGLVVTLLAVLSIGIQTVKAAMTEPVKTLKCE